MVLAQRLRLRLSFLWERLCIWLANGFSRKGLWAVDIANAGADITRLPAFRAADVIHLHWVNQGLLSMDQLARIFNSGKPVVWTMHDLWPIAGICHHMLDCSQFQEHCSFCPQLRYPGAHDLSWKVFGQKQRVYSSAPLTFVGVSHWEADMARRSALARGHSVVVIPNAIPVEQFHRQDRVQARAALGLPENARVVVFGAARLDQPMKGINRLFEALGHLLGSEIDTPEKPLHLLLFGGCKDSQLWQRIPCAYTYAGIVSGADVQSRIYSAADVVVSASDRESFGLTLAEAMACGCTPVSFDCGGQTDIIEHGRNGYLAHYPDVNDLAVGIRWALENPVEANTLRQSIVSRFSADVVAQQYIRLYGQLCVAAQPDSRND